DLGFTATPDTGYQVDKWSVDGTEVQTGGNTYTLTNIQDVHTVYVTFKQLGHVITPSAGFNGSINPDSPVMVKDDDSQQFTAYPKTGYEVDRWYLDGSEVQIGGNNYMLSNIHADHTVYVTFKQKLIYSLDIIEFNDDKEFDNRIVNNNSFDPVQPDKSRTHVVRVVGLGPDPDGVMSMHNLKDLDPTSPNYGQIIHARAKGSFIKTNSDEILIRFKYLFNTSDPSVELVIYLSDSPELMAHDNPLRNEHYLEVARLSPPPAPRPGSMDSGRFGIFEKIVWAGSLNFNEGTWIELELVEPENPGIYLYSNMASPFNESEDDSVLIDDWSPAVQCYGICLDINWDNFIDEADFLTVMSEFGLSATDDRACLEGVFSNDGTLDVFDITSWDWAMNSESRLLNFCGVPLASDSMAMMTFNVADFKITNKQLPFANLLSNMSGLLISGKRGAMDAPSKLKDRLYVFDNNGLCGGWFEPASDRCNIRLVQGANGELYQINSETGVLRLDDNVAIIPPGKTTYANEPRYNSSATIYVGIQKQDIDLYGRPVFDADFDADYAYVTPVVVNPNGGKPYTATAKLELLDGANPPYKVVRLYDDPPLPNDNQYRNYLREIELDSAGNLYVLNVHFLNESNILWRYYTNGNVERFDLGRPDSGNYLPSPIGMYMSDSTDMLYLASALYNPVESDSTEVYGISTKETLAFERFIIIYGMHHVTDITEDLSTGSLWIVGFNMEQIPQYPNPFQLPFYYPYLAEIRSDSDSGQAIPLLDRSSHDLALPISVIWTQTMN
ncbi:MAG: InlB B-repeat-containing protein, partial [Planctomycetota bacterium]